MSSFTKEIREGGFVFGIKEEVHSPDIKPFYIGSVIFAPTGEIPWKIPRNRCYYRIEPDLHEARITDVVVEEGRRGRGIGRKLVELAEKRCREHGAIRIVGYSDPAYHDFWRKLDFKIVAENNILKRL